MADFQELNSELDALAAQVTATEGIEASAMALIGGFAAQVDAAVTKALTADNAADGNSIVAAKEAIAGAVARFKAASDALGAAVGANQTPTPTPTPDPAPTPEPVPVPDPTPTPDPVPDPAPASDPTGSN